jgi:hypothetical protein
MKILLHKDPRPEPSKWRHDKIWRKQFWGKVRVTYTHREMLDQVLGFLCTSDYDLDFDATNCKYGVTSV